MKKIIKYLLWIVLVLLILIVGLALFLLTGLGKKTLKSATVTYLESKFKTPVGIGHIDYNIPTMLQINDLYLVDQKADTLIRVEQLKVDLSMLALIKNQFAVQHLDIRGLKANLYRATPDTTFNYQYLIDAFASPTTTSPKSNDASFLYKIDLVSLSDIDFTFNDQSGGIHFDIKLDSLKLQPSIIDPDRMVYKVHKLYLEGVESNTYTFDSILPDVVEDSTSTPLVLSITDLIINDAYYNFQSLPDSFTTTSYVKHLNASMPDFNLLNQHIDIKHISIDSAHQKLRLSKIATEDTSNVATESDSSHWKILAKNLDLQQIQFEYDDPKEGYQKGIFDYNHINIKDAYLAASDILYTSDTIRSQIHRIALNERSGFKLQDFRTKLTYHNNGVTLNELFIKTPHSRIAEQASISYPSLASISQQLHQLYLKTMLKSSYVAINDVLLFTPKAYHNYLNPYKNQTIHISGMVHGYINQLNLNNLSAKGLSQTSLLVNGTLNGLPYPNQLSYDLNIKKLTTGEADLKHFLSKEITNEYNIPSRIKINGTLKGTLKKHTPNLHIQTSDGSLKIAGTVNTAKKNGETYHLNLLTNQLNLGKILKKQEQLGTLSMAGNIHGTSFSLHNMNTSINGQVQQLGLNGYNYQDVNLVAKISNQIADVQLTSNDKNATIDLAARIDLKNPKKSLNSKMNLDNLDLKALGFTSEEMKVGGSFDFNFSSLDPDRPIGTLKWSQPTIHYKGTYSELDSIYINAKIEEGKEGKHFYTAQVDTLIDATMETDIPLTQLGTYFISRINNYFKLTKDSIPFNPNYRLDLNASVKNHPLIQKFVPDLQSFAPTSITSTIDSTNFVTIIQTDSILYGSHKMNRILLAMLDKNGELNYDFTLSKYKSMPDGLDLYNGHVFGRMYHDTITTDISTTDSNEIEQYAIKANAFRLGDNFYAHLVPNLRIFYNLWNIEPNNEIAFGPNGFYFNNFKISNNNEMVAINSENYAEFGSPLLIKTTDFELANITKIFSSGDTLLAEGKLNAVIKAEFKDSSLSYQATATANDFKALGQDIGVIKLNSNSKDENTYYIDAELKDKGNYITAVGDYFLKPQMGNNFNIDVAIKQFNLTAFEGFGFGHIRNSSGNLTGALLLKGTVEQPRIKGSLTTDSLKTTISLFNNPLLMPKETVTFDGGHIKLDNFKLIDSLGVPAYLNGNINTQTYRSYDLNLTAQADKWIAMNSTALDYELMYGFVKASTDLNINGTSDAPDIYGNVKVHNGSVYNFVNLEEGTEVQESEGIMKIVSNLDSFNYTLDTMAQNATSRIERALRLNVNLETEENAQFVVWVDPVAGDKLEVSGDAFINANMNPGGNMVLAGTYKIKEGFYTLFINLIKRKFKILPNSTLNLAGSPMDAQVDIKAAYDAYISPYELIANQVQDPSQLNYYKQRLPFQVILTIEGKALKPTIKFDVVLPDNATQSVSTDVANTVQAKLRSLRLNQAEMNKQVFAVLIAERFVSEDIFNSSSALSIEYYARQSASRFISQQLNELTKNLVNGVDLALDLQSSEDYSTGTKQHTTNLSVNASKSLFNDRLVVTIGNDFQIEGAAKNNNKNQFIPGNISLDYKLTNDGRYSLRAYRKNQFQNISNGYVTETGAGFRLNYQYNTLKELLLNRKIKKEVKENEAIQKKKMNQTDSLNKVVEQ